MAFSEIELKRIDSIVGVFCRERVPVQLWEKLRLDYRIKGHDVVMFEVRPDWQDTRQKIETPVAKFKFVRTVDEWRLFWMRADLRWHRYDICPPSPDLNDLVQEVDRDIYGCFFG
ncbi:MAG: DUF3024 domain-containing protein [Thermoleophilia bacterium]